MLTVRSVAKIVFRSVVSNIYNLVGLKSVVRGSSKDHYFNTTYNKSFKIPPVFNVSMTGHTLLLLDILRIIRKMGNCIHVLTYSGSQKYESR